jgi:formate-dependent phosphoribosylglycinamide formyltransferase (GAR transformylase)
MRILAMLIAGVIGGGAVSAGEADVIGVELRKDGDGTYSFDVTVRHADTGWKHFANKWEVFAPDGKTVLGVRVLHHPHEDEQPFTRSQSGIRIPAGTKFVIVRAHDSVHGYGGVEKRVELKP